ncbi:hypothetical protein HME9302_00595 [Alteripontixanthobacter maritimus]|uniref:Uncharacterized protein n=1 Tax=Alteripontixanthobacter maritimus TaxID=2161824 RepID=A0A369Q7Z7_9SPHN|nr:hypothetical protein HME9302_00595 [Alteripontixanthobacter maritimus]
MDRDHSDYLDIRDRRSTKESEITKDAKTIGEEPIDANGRADRDQIANTRCVRHLRDRHIRLARSVGRAPAWRPRAYPGVQHARPSGS